jgi:hypothetical protein
VAHVNLRPARSRDHRAVGTARHLGGIAAGVAAAATGAALVVVEPKLVAFLVAGILAGAAVWLASRAAGRWVLAAAGLVIVGCGGLLLLGAVDSSDERPAAAPAGRVPGAVRGVAFTARLRYDERAHAFVGRVVVRVGRRLLERDAVDRATRARILSPPLRDTVFGRAWRFDGARGDGNAELAYVRAIRDPVTLEHLPDVLATHRFGGMTIRSPHLRATLVPKDGSTYVLRAPKRFIYETDPAAVDTHFGDEDIRTVTLNGLEDDAELRSVSIRVANSLGRQALYQRVRAVALWSAMWWLLGPVGAGTVAYFVQRELKRRFPEPATAAA